MSGARIMQEVARNAYKLSAQNLRVREHSEELGVDGKLILMGLRGTVLEDMNWVHLAQDMYR